MVYSVHLLICCLLLVSGCAHVSKRASSQMPRSIKEIYAQSHRDVIDQGSSIGRDLKEEKVFGYVKPYVPVIDPPIVKKVWIPSHKSEQDAGVLIAGHWIYIMVKGPTWFIDEEVQNQIEINIMPHKGKEQKNTKSVR